MGFATFNLHPAVCSTRWMQWVLLLPLMQRLLFCLPLHFLSTCLSQRKAYSLLELQLKMSMFSAVDKALPFEKFFSFYENEILGVPVYAKLPITPCAGCARLLRRAAWVSWCSLPGILLYIPAMFKAELAKRKTALKKLVVKLLALWWDAWAEQGAPHSYSYRRNCLFLVVVLPAADWQQCLVLGDLPAGWSHTAPQGIVQAQKSRYMKPQCLPPFERLTLRIGRTLWLQCCGQASALWYVYKITIWKHRSPIPRNLQGGGIWCMFFTKRKTLGGLRKGFFRLKSDCLTGNEWTALSLKQKPGWS